MRQVTFLLVGDNYASTTLSPLEIFHSAGYLWEILQGGEGRPLFEVKIASQDGKPVQSSQGVIITPHCSIDEVAHTDIIFLPASGLDLDTQLPLSLASSLA